MSVALRLRVLAVVIGMALVAACTPVAPTAAPAPSAPEGPRVQLAVFPEDSEQPLLDKIAGVKTRAWMKMYLLTDFRIVDALVAARARGADVRAIVEQDVFRAGPLAKAAYDKLKSVGIETKYASPAFKLSHEKSFVLDDEAVIMTANMTKSAFTRNREFVLTTSDARIVNEAVAAFSSDWDRTPFAPTEAALVWSPENARTKLTALTRSATRTLDVYAEEAVDKDMLAELVDLAKRGVAVRLLVSPADGSEPDANAPGLDVLQRAGVKIRLLKSPFIHAKAFVADGARAYVGSHNLSYSSLNLNRELGLLFTDASALSRLSSTFEKDWNKAKDR